MLRAIQTLAVGAIAAMLAAPAFAHPPQGHNGRGYEREYRDHRHDRSDRYDRYDRYERRHDKRDRRHKHRSNRHRDHSYIYIEPRVRYSSPRYAGPGYIPPIQYHYRPGQYLPRHVKYSRVHDYRHRRLPPPRRGHYYADVDGDILMIAAATGLIVWALNN